MKNKVIQFVKKSYSEYMNIVWLCITLLLVAGATRIGVFLVNCYFESIKFLILPGSMQGNIVVTSFLYILLLLSPLLLVLWQFLKIRNMVKQFFNKFYNEYIKIVWVRIMLLILAIIAGSFLAYCYFDIIKEQVLPVSMQSNTKATSLLYSSLSAFLLLFVLWVFRTKDIREQINKTEQQIDTTQFNKAVDLTLATTNEKNDNVIDVVKRSAGVTMLAQLYQRCDNDLRKSIDNITMGLNLKSIKIPNINLSNMNFSNANLFNANLQKTNLQGIKLLNANLIGANLQGTELQDTKLNQAVYNDTTQFPDNFKPDGMYKIAPYTNLQGANLQNIDLRNVSVLHAKLECVNLQNSNLQNADLRYAKLQGSNLINANLHRANLQNANLQNANLQRATLQGATLQNVDLHRADLQNVTFLDATLINVNLQGADLRGADLHRAKLQSANLNNANLQNIDLQGFSLQGFDLQSAVLEGSNLQKANLQEN